MIILGRWGRAKDQTRTYQHVRMDCLSHVYLYICIAFYYYEKKNHTKRKYIVVCCMPRRFSCIKLILRQTLQMNLQVVQVLKGLSLLGRDAVPDGRGHVRVHRREGSLHGMHHARGNGLRDNASNQRLHHDGNQMGHVDIVQSQHRRMLTIPLQQVIIEW